VVVLWIGTGGLVDQLVAALPTAQTKPEKIETPVPAG
jgi:hypothetical protein